MKMKATLLTFLTIFCLNTMAGGQILFCSNPDITISVYETKKGNITFRDQLYSDVGPTSTYPKGFWDEDNQSWVLTSTEGNTSFEIIVNEKQKNLLVYKRTLDSAVPYSTFLVPCSTMKDLDRLEMANGSSRVGTND